MANLITDYVVVGGGLSGCVIASRLSQSGKDVILLEAGPDPKNNPAVQFFLSGLTLQGGEFDYTYPTEPVPTTADRVHHLSSGKGLGGGTVINYGGWLRGDAADYDEWAEVVGDKRWSYEGLKPWFVKSENFYDSGADPQEHGFDGPMHVTAVSAAEGGQRKYPLRETIKNSWAELDVPHNIDRKNGASGGLNEMHENCDRNGARQPSNVVYPLDNVKVFTDTPVYRIIFDDTKKATGVELVDGRKVSARKQVIISAGSYQTPKILMLSGIGPSADLAQHGIPLLHESPHVGENLHDHYAIHLAYRLRNPSLGYAFGSAGFQNPAFLKGLPWDWVANQSLPEEILAKNQHEAKPGWGKRNVYEVFDAYVVPGIPGIPIDGTHISTSTMLLLPTSRGKVTIRSNSPTDLPSVRPNYLSTQLDRDSLIQAVRTTIKVMTATESMKPIVVGESPPIKEGLEGLTPLTVDTSDEAILERLQLTGEQHQHSGGTAAMGKVVDGEGKVLGVNGLRIADASIIPVPLGGHPQATLYAMAEQLVSMILADS
ncbi:putative GMC oxidoreductase [Daldinia caldariorum]|uniref:putative GMC oxidoreductase n=1 Tax=Daldinia caldariorum TaxID=326644 RepID=UPI002008B86B|nr:putative GMC oxidoreductase [Daldinia caldariorum]KAI1469344.1 putative GMC oxidoreductase [Daldinia caldariorum]